MNIENYESGADCTCAAHGECECCCGVDWTPKEVYLLRAEIKEGEKILTQFINRFANFDSTEHHETFQNAITFLNRRLVES